jgi:hypothetical protein
LFDSQEFVVSPQDKSKKRPKLVLNLSDCNRNARKAVRDAIKAKHALVTHTHPEQKFLVIFLKKIDKKRQGIEFSNIKKTAEEALKTFLARTAERLPKSSKRLTIGRARYQRRRDPRYLGRPPYAQLT